MIDGVPVAQGCLNDAPGKGSVRVERSRDGSSNDLVEAGQLVSEPLAGFGTKTFRHRTPGQKRVQGCRTVRTV
jgi:hypothetical protein